MSASSSTTDYLLRPRLPVGGLITMAVVCLVGAVLLVVSLQLEWHPFISIALAILMAAGFALAVLAVLSMGRLSVRVELDPDGYRLRGPRGTQQGRWADVTRVTQNGDVVTIHRGEERRDRLVFTSADDDVVGDLLADMTRRLDAAKGYTLPEWD